MAEDRLNRIHDAAVAIGAGVTVDKDVNVNDAQILAVIVALTGAASGDLAVVVQPFFFDSTPTICPIALTAVRSTGPTLSGGVVYYVAEFDVGSLTRVRVKVTNNNAGAQTINFRSIGLS